MSSFEQFRLPPSIQASLKAMNFQKPTPIQEKAIPVALTGSDLLGMAQTGTGKTAAFLIPVLTRLASLNGKTALILAPTRELALQIHVVLKQLVGKNQQMRSALLIGGLPLKAQVKELNSHPRILVATPGRLVDHLNHMPRLLQPVAIMVVDEADRMLDMGFYPQLKMIRKFVPQKRQTMMFSATFPENIKKLAGEFLFKPEQVSVGETHRPVPKIEQAIIETTAKEKNDVLLDELNARQGSVLIFTRTKHRTHRLMRYLQDYGYKVTFLHGNRTQAQRKSAIEGFRRGDFRILVATDIASRGLDIDDIAHVINYDLPQQPEDYVHRIGRTARNGKSGRALCLLTPEDRGQWKQIHRAMQSKSV
jgi:superfamily II DNA/RNA helicase